MIDFEFFEHHGQMVTAEVTKTATGYVAALADDPGLRAEAAGRAEAIALLKLRLPAAVVPKPVAPEGTPPPKKPLRRLGRPGQVLVVDDNPAALQVAMMVCQLCGHGALSARDGYEAWRVLNEAPVDLVLTDLHMPGMGGLAFVRALKAQRPDLPILAVTGAGPNGVKALETLGVDGVVRKPFGVQQLAAAIGALITPA